MRIGSGSLDGQATGRSSLNTRVTLDLLTSTVVLQPNTRRLYAVLQNQNDQSAIINIVLGPDAGVSPSTGITLYPHDLVVLEQEMFKDGPRCEWTGAVSAITSNVAGAPLGVIEVSSP